MEIERKFWVKTPPDFVDELVPVAILQGYLAVEKDGNETRIRAMGDAFFLTVKGGGTLTRGEWEIEITQAQFDALWPATTGRRVVKDRYVLVWKGVTIELDQYHDALEGLWVAEVEFEDEAAARQFSPMEWMGLELTEMTEFKNKALAKGAKWADLLAQINSLTPD